MVPQYELVDPKNVFGYESPKNLEILTSLVLAIEEGAELPIVQLVRVSQSEFHIPYKSRFEVKEGGHHRILAHYLLRKKVNCAIVEAARIPEGERIPIPRIGVVQDPHLFMEHIEWQGGPYIQPTSSDLYRVAHLYNKAIDQYRSV